MSKQKVFIKQNEATIKNGTAGLQVAYIEGEKWEGEILMLTVLVRDMDGGLAGPYKIPQSETEVREIAV